MTFRDYMAYAGSMMDKKRVPALFIRLPVLDKNGPYRRFSEFSMPGYEDKLMVVQGERLFGRGPGWYDVEADGMLYRIHMPHPRGDSFRQSFFWPVFSYDDIPSAVRFWRSRMLDKPVTRLSGKFKDFADRVEISLVADGIILPEYRPEKTEKTPRRKIPDIV